MSEKTKIYVIAGDGEDYRHFVQTHSRLLNPGVEFAWIDELTIGRLKSLREAPIHYTHTIRGVEDVHHGQQIYIYVKRAGCKFVKWPYDINAPNRYTGGCT